MKKEKKNLVKENPTLKKVRNTDDLEKAMTITASKVVKPPLNTAGPIVSSAFSDFSTLFPR